MINEKPKQNYWLKHEIEAIENVPIILKSWNLKPSAVILSILSFLFDIYLFFTDG